MGTAYYAQRDPLKWIAQWAEELGGIYTISSPLGTAVVVARPEWARQVMVERYSRYQEKSRSYAVLRLLMGNGLVTSSGEFWRGQRKMTQPAFHRKRLEGIFSMMVSRSIAAVEKLARDAGDLQGTELSIPLSTLTLDIISRAMFSTDVEGTAAEVGKYIAMLNEDALRMLRHPWRFFLPRKFPTPFNAREFAAREALYGIVDGIITERRKAPDGHDDLLAMFLSACDEETGRGMTDEQLRDEVMTMFVAGHETTANAMCWLLHLVASHPEVEAGLWAEIDSAEAAASLSAGNITGLPYTRQVVEESLRLFPTIWSVGRRAGEDDEIGGYQIPAGTNVMIPIFHFHWSPEYWDEPMKFDPGRFAPDRRPPNEPMIYFPFGAGARGCIGNQFAIQELVIMTAIFHRHLKFRPVPGFEVVPDPLITLRPKNGMRLRVMMR
ncbi:MAG: cytochrome [Akkermansiaceae bacterium]|nr:cytochrome [Akkermansiaceae bacterium]